ncbi:MASE1 domain-containing protein [Dyella sp. C11]|uniref:MASE1 domain-containing protein n=1 Tax=Dyella sp. C11 TaxID=2126991 RepID=UPI000D659DEA|nr:MASE1 domain-containing protein [Dyella sp. C11]
MVTATKGKQGARTHSAFQAAVRQLCVVLAYAVAYPVLREFSVSHWNLNAGLRVLCLLLVPPRYWLALAVGEAIPLAWLGWSSHDRFGTLWAVFVTVPPILLSAPVFVWYRRRVTVFREGVVNVGALMSSVFVGSTISALVNTATLAVLTLPPGETPPAITTHVLLEYFLGSYLGALTLVPAVFAWMSWSSRWQPAGAPSPKWAVAMDCIKGVVPPLALLVWLASASHGEEVVEVARLAMFLPVAWLTMRWGWQGASVGGLLASVAIQLTMTVVRDPAVIQAQALIAFAVSSLVMLGARLSPKSGTAAMGEASGDDRLRGFLLAQQGLYQEELRLRHVAESLDRLGQSMRDGQRRMMDRLRPVLPANMEQSYARHLDLTQMEMQRLSDALHPRAWREHGLAATFQNGPLSKAASLVGARYHCTLTGDGLNLLAPDVHMMLYRQACEVLVYMLAREPMKRIRVHIRGGCTHGRRWVVLRMTGARAAPALRGRPVPEWRQMVSLLGTNGQGMTTVRERALIYGGVVHERESEDVLGVTLLLHDALRVDVRDTVDVPLARPVSA